MMTGATVRAQLDTLEVNKQEGGFVGYGEQHAWTQNRAYGTSPILMIFFFHITLM